MTHSRPAIHHLLDEHGLAPRRDLGQNFVGDPNTVRRIADLARVDAGDHVVEIGAGLGSLTLALADRGAKVVALEVDAGLIPALREVVHERSNVRIVHADATAMEWPAELDPPDPPGGWVLVANLPYNVATPLVCDVLDKTPCVSRMLVLVQREVAERFTASPRSKAYGAVSVKVAYWAEASIVGLVPASVFVPRPNVESALVSIVRRPAPQLPTTPPDVVFPIVRQAFAQRRKMLRRSLADTLDATAFARAGVSPTARPEELDVEAWCRLAGVAPTGTAAHATR